MNISSDTARAAEIAKLRSAAAVRERCAMVHRWVAVGRSPHFELDEERLESVARYVAEVTRAAYPDLRIPYHSRWRHFAAGGIDRWQELSRRLRVHPLERARVAIDLVTVSVLLDAGAGDAWRYREGASGRSFARSEGLAIASFEMFCAGAFSSDQERPHRVDDTALALIEAPTLARHFQASTDNPLVGIDARSGLLRALGAALSKRGDLFGRAPARPGNLVDYFVSGAHDHRLSAATVLATLLEAFALIWPSGLTVAGIPLGDAGRHPAVDTGDITQGVVPFHKLSQWLAYSLIEPLESAGLSIERLDELTGLPEYRNGGLLVDLGVIRPRKQIDLERRHDVHSELVVEWRALTVILMDQLLPLVRAELGLDSPFSVPQMLQGGTWSAGRKTALKLRPPDGPSPILVAADGTVF
jgi:hypothetical protein